MLALWLSAVVVYTRVDTGMRDLTLWVIVLLIQSIPYFASLLLAVCSALPSLPSRIIGRADDMELLAQSVLESETLELRN